MFVHRVGLMDKIIINLYEESIISFLNAQYVSVSDAALHH